MSCSVDRCGTPCIPKTKSLKDSDIVTNTLKFRLPLYCSQDCESNKQFLFVMKLQIILWKNLQGYEFYFGSCIKCGWLLRETQAYIKLAISQTASTVTYAGHGRGWRMRGVANNSMQTQCSRHILLFAKLSTHWKSNLGIQKGTTV